MIVFKLFRWIYPNQFSALVLILRQPTREKADFGMPLKGFSGFSRGGWHWNPFADTTAIIPHGITRTVWRACMRRRRRRRRPLRLFPEKRGHDIDHKTAPPLRRAPGRATPSAQTPPPGPPIITPPCSGASGIVDGGGGRSVTPIRPALRACCHRKIRYVPPAPHCLPPSTTTPTDPVANFAATRRADSAFSEKTRDGNAHGPRTGARVSDACSAAWPEGWFGCSTTPYCLFSHTC